MLLYLSIIYKAYILISKSNYKQSMNSFGDLWGWCANCKLGIVTQHQLQMGLFHTHGMNFTANESCDQEQNLYISLDLCYFIYAYMHGI